MANPWRLGGLALTLGLLLLVGCVSRSTTTTRPLESGVVWFDSVPGNARFGYPPSWHPVVDDTILTLVPIGESAIGRHTLAIDMPDLPLHIPGLIPLGLVEQGFVADVKRRYKQAVVEPTTGRLIGGVDGRLIRARQDGDGGVVVLALVCVRGDHVFVIDAETDDRGAQAAQAAFDKVVDSWQWTE